MLLKELMNHKFDHVDKDGWPHYKELKAIKNLSEEEQQDLMKRAIISYLN